MFDIDDFKQYNDTYGHSVGDEILKQASILIKKCCRSHDVVARMGGDEFAIIFWDNSAQKPVKGKTERRSGQSDHPREALFIAKRLKNEIKKADLDMLGPEGKGTLTISGGLASFPNDGDTAEEVFEKADQALLDAKKSGKNRIYLVGKPQNNIDSIE